MSVFGSIVSAIFGSKHAASVAPTAGGSATPPPSSSTSASPGMPAPTGTHGTGRYHCSDFGS